MDVVIIEDEDLAAASLEKMLQECSHTILVKEKLESVAEAINWFKTNTCDLILSDIHLGDGDSFEIFETLDIKIPIIFTTAFDEYAIKSFQFFAIDYLLKPYDKTKLNIAIEKYINFNIAENNYENKLHSLLKEMNVPEQKIPKERFLVSKGAVFISIKRKDTAFFMAQGKHLFLYTKKGESYLYNDTISNLEQKLSSKYFFKINRKYIVQHNAIKSIAKYSGNRIKIELKNQLQPEKLILVSTQRANDFKEWLNN